MIIIIDKNYYYSLPAWLFIQFDYYWLSWSSLFIDDARLGQTTVISRILLLIFSLQNDILVRVSGVGAYWSVIPTPNVPNEANFYIEATL